MVNLSLLGYYYFKVILLNGCSLQLSLMINHYYHQHIRQLKQAFHANKDLPHVILFDFFEKEHYHKIKKKLSTINLTPEKNPLTHSYTTVNTTLFTDSVFEFIFKIILSKTTKLNLQNNTNIKQILFQFKTKDYLILNDNAIEPPGYDLIFDFTEHWDEHWGGSIIYVDGSGDYTQIPTKGNSLTIIRREKTVHKFVKYVNHLAKDNKRIFLCTTISQKVL